MITGQSGCGVKYAVKKSGSAVGYCALSIKCGTRDEAGFNSGIAHFTEHTLFKGTSGKSAAVINGYLDRLGGELNAYTTKEEIVLHATVLKEDLKKAVSLLLELATSPIFPAGEIDTERGVVIDEIRSYKDSPADDIYDRFEERLFAGHPLSMPILGTEASVKAITAKELRRFVKEKFLPGAMALTMVADLDEALMENNVIKILERFFPGPAGMSGSIPQGDFESGVNQAAKVPFNRFEITENKDNHEVNLVLGGLAPSLYEAKERFATVLLSNILAGPASNSILNRTLRERNGWVYAVEASYNQYSDTGILTVSLGCDKANMDKCLLAVRKEILKLQTIPLSPSRLHSAKKQLLGQLAIASDNGEAQCLSMGKSLLAYGRVSPDEEIRENIEAVSSSDILSMACRIFEPSLISTLIFI